MSQISLEGRSVIVAMCLGQLGSLLPHVVVPSILAAFLIPEWHLSGAQAGLLAGSGAAGYMLAVPVLATLTDRIDARKILIAGSAVSALGTLLFGLFATGLWSGALFNAIAGVGFAGAYMPGLKALTDRLAPGNSSRAITLYTSSFSFGVGLSFLVVATGRGKFWLAQRVLCDRARSAGDAGGLPAVATGRTETGPGTPAGFRAGVPQHQGDGIRARLRRALLRALRHPDLAGGVLDLCRCVRYGKRPS